MISSLRPVLPLFDFTAPRWGSSIRLRPRHVFHAHRPLSHGRHSAKEKEISRKSLKARSFPRESESYLTKIPWVTRQVLILPVNFIRMIGSCLDHCCRSWMLGSRDKGIDFNSRAGWLLSDFGSGCVGLLAEVVLPWGIFNIASGGSMLPTFSAAATPTYASFTYFEKRDVRRGDVVVVEFIEPDGRSRFLGKRVAALEGDRIRVAMCSTQKIPHSIVHVRYPSVISLLSSVFTYGYIGTEGTLLSSWG